MVLRTREKHPKASTAEAELGRLLKRLANEQRGAVLLDTHIDGVRCVVTRAADDPSSAAPTRQPITPPPLSRRPSPTLSPREREIARMVSEGYPNKIIADVLQISTWTVGTHMRRMFAKLGVTSRAALVARALEAGLIEAPARPDVGR